MHFDVTKIMPTLARFSSNVCPAHSVDLESLERTVIDLDSPE
jgi:hypothetical protein